jgi:hypothetical protein
MIKVPPDSELSRLLAQMDEKPLLLEKDGIRYAIYRADDAERGKARADTARNDEQVRPTSLHSRLADGYQSIPALKEPKTWKEIEEIVRDERAGHYAAKGV